ncbi:MAG: SUMF1/EgtB/PvdO family nonheme iron enzyme [Planctomycetales bacterium]|nr:SUMF1/EgtB/PvdO family nonheme iron enzyme [Planctomycetales bacterium]
MQSNYIQFTLSMLILLIPTWPVFGQGRKLAVVVGVGTYRANSGLPSLGNAPGNDAANISDVLREQGFTVFEMTHATARVDGQENLAPNIAYIRDQISGVLDFPNLGRDDVVLITLSGHGVQFEDIKGAGKTPSFYFCPADATITGIKTANQITERNHLLPLEELYAQLAKCNATTKLLIVDACRNDPTQPGVFRSGLASATLPKLPPPTGGTAALFSCKANQRAVQDSKLQQGIFAKFLVDGLKGAADQPLAGLPADGVVTFGELSTYVANNTYAYVYRNYNGEKQSPELRGEFDLNLPLARRLGSAAEFTNSVGMKLVLIKAGSFMMGSPDSDQDAYNFEKPQHRVTLSQDYYLGTTEVTQGQWEAVMGTTPWRGKTYVQEGSNYSATYVSWEDAIEFCKKLSSLEGKSYRLPTEAEWEYACRGGTTTAYSFGADASQLSRYAWFNENAWDQDEKYAHPVAQKMANPFGLYDMHGNVYEWCSDWHGEYSSGSVTDPRGPGRGSYRVSRGGSWNFNARYCRSAYRINGSPDYRNDYLGFRVAVGR